MMKSLSPRLLRALSLESRDPVCDDEGSNDLSGGRSDFRPSPSLVLLPANVTGRSIKGRLPLVTYGELLERRAGGAEAAVVEGGGVCVVCMDGLEGGDDVREQGNCGHVCHAGCLDAWIDQGRNACPLCRARLLPTEEEEQGHEDGGGGYDPWRAERMVYLFGEDCCF